MKGKKAVILFVMIGLILLISIAVYSWLKREQMTKTKEQAAVVVEVMPINERTAVEKLEAIGTAKAYESVTITANTSEYITKLHFEDGEQVKKGDKLVELETAEEMTQLDEAGARLKEAELQLERIKKLLEKHYSTQSEYDTQKASVDSIRAQVDRIKTTVNDRIITAPFDGVLGFREVSEGLLVEPGDEIVTLDMVQPLRIDFSVPEKYLNYIKIGQEFSVQSVAYPNELFTGKVVTINARIDEQSRSVMIRGIIDNKHLKLKPGMLLNLSLPLFARQVLTVPEEALLAQEDKRYIFIVPKNSNTALRRAVNIISRHGKLLDITNDIEKDAFVVTQGAFKLQDGQEVVVNHVAQ